MYRNNLLHTGVAADVVPSPLNLKWKQTFGGDVDSSPAVVGSRLYVGSDDGSLYALDVATGNIIWSFKEIAPLPVTIAWDSSPAVATVGGQTVIFAGNDNDYLYAIRDDGATATKLWSYTDALSPADINSSPAVTSIAGTQVVIFGSEAGALGGGLYAVVAATGALYAGWPINPFRPAVGVAFTTSPAILGQTIFIGSSGAPFNLYGVNLGNGVLLWAAPFTAGGAIFSSPAVANVVVGGVPTDLVFFGADDSKLYALVAASGALQWSFAVGGKIDSSPAVATIPTPPLACSPGPTVAVIFGSDDNNLYAVRASDGTPCWTFPSTGALPFRSSPTVSGQTVYAGSDDGNLYAVDINTGSWRWSFPSAAAMGDPATPPNPVVSGTTVYAGSKDNKLYAFEGPVVTTTLTSIVSTTTTTTVPVTETSTVTTSTTTTTVSTGTTQTETTTTTSVITSLTTTWAAVSPPSAIPGFPVEGILLGLVGGLVALTLLGRRRRRQ